MMNNRNANVSNVDHGTKTAEADTFHLRAQDVSEPPSATITAAAVAAAMVGGPTLAPSADHVKPDMK